MKRFLTLALSLLLLLVSSSSAGVGGVQQEKNKNKAASYELDKVAYEFAELVMQKQELYAGLGLSEEQVVQKVAEGLMETVMHQDDSYDPSIKTFDTKQKIALYILVFVGLVMGGVLCCKGLTWVSRSPETQRSLQRVEQGFHRVEQGVDLAEGVARTGARVGNGLRTLFS